MSKITATFPDGFADTYNGTRDVRAAWRVVDLETGETARSGHSLDRARAEKTAKSALSEMLNAYRPFYKLGRYEDFRYRLGGEHGHFRRHVYTKLVEAGHAPEGLKTIRQVADHVGGFRQLYQLCKSMNEDAAARHETRYKIEIIDI